MDSHYDNPLEEWIGKNDLSGGTVLQTLMRAHRHVLVNGHWKVAEHIEQAVYALRDSEHEKMRDHVRAAMRETAGISGDEHG